MSWHFQIMRHQDGDRTAYFAVHEVYIDEQGEKSWTENGEVVGACDEDVRRTLNYMLKDCCNHPVLDYESGKPIS